VARADVDANAPDVAPALAKITDAGAECLAINLPPAGVAQTLTAVQQSGEDLMMGVLSAVVPQQLLDALGDLTDGLIAVGDHVSRYDPEAEVVRADMDAAGGQDDEVTPVGLLCWTASQVLMAALEDTEGEVTPESLIEAIEGLEDVDMQGVIPPFTTREFEDPTFARVMNPNGISFRVEDAALTRLGDFYDLTSVLED
jgi:ABC-type branched-subunit amino acid transport system substrate-binding protein